MKIINLNKLLTLAMMVVFIAALSSCKDDDTKSSKIELLSFGPSGVFHGDPIEFIGNNLNKVTAIDLQGVSIPATQFQSQTNEKIVIIVPMEAEAGLVTLKTPDGDIISKTILSLDVPITITSVTAEAKPGTNITISGEFMNWVEEVWFADDILVTEFVSQSLTELVVTVPMEAKTGTLTLVGGGTEPLTIETEDDLIVSLPTVSALSPASIKHTEELTLEGTNLDLVTEIKLPGGSAISDFITATETQLSFKVPNTVVKGMLTLVVASGVEVVTTQELTIILPKGTDLSPKPATPGTSNITITGTNLDLVKSLKLAGVTNAIETFISKTPTQIVLALPASATAGGIGYTTIHGYSNNLGVTVSLPGGGPSPLSITMYDEAMAAGGGDWSWEVASSDPANTDQFYSGSKSWKYSTTNGGGLSSGGLNPINASAMTYFSFSVYGGPGTSGKQIACILNDKWDSYNSVTLVEGQWKEFKVALANYGASVDKTAITRWTLKVEGLSSSTIYADRVGFE